MLTNALIFLISFVAVIRSATLATRYATGLARSFHVSQYIVGFIIVAFISVLPETLIALNALFQDSPAFGLGTLFGSNVADLTLVFAIVILLSRKGIKIESKVLSNNSIYPLLLVLPLIFGFDGFYSRFDGIVLMLTGMIFYAIIYSRNHEVTPPATGVEHRFRNTLFLIMSMAALLLGSHFTVESATALADGLGIPSVLIALLVVGVGTTMPELFFSIQSHRKNEDDLATGDILGTVLTDATIVVGLLAVIKPFAFSENIIFVTGLFMLVASLVLLHFMRTGKVLSKKEGYALLGFYIVFVITEFVINRS